MLLRFIKIITVALLTSQCLDTHAIRLIDGDTNAVLSLASITDCKGNVIGMTDQTGEIPSIAARLFPITFSYTGYEPLAVNDLGNKDIVMVKHIYELPEIAVSPGNRPLLHVTAYMREIASMLCSSDSLTSFRESIIDFLVPIDKTKEKGWKKPRILASRTFSRMTDSKGLDSITDGHGLEYMLWASSFLQIPSSIQLPEKLKNSEMMSADTVMGKYYPKAIWSRSSPMIHCYGDALANEKEHVMSPLALKMLGLTTDVTNLSFNYIFIPEEDTQIKATDLSQMSLSADMLVKGKLFKKSFDSSTPVNLREYAEIFIIDREFISNEEAKLLKKEAPVVKASEIKAPENAPAVHPAIKEMMRRVSDL